MKFSSVADILSDIADGKLVIVIDSEDRENEGDLVIASELATPETINFCLLYTSPSPRDPE